MPNNFLTKTAYLWLESDRYIFVKTNLSQSKTLKKARRSMMWMRLSYFIAFVLMTVMCSQNYLVQRENEIRIQSMIALSNQFSVVSNGFSEVAKRSRVLSLVYLADAVDLRTEGMTLEQQEIFYRTAEPEKKIQIARRKRLDSLQELYDQIITMEKLWIEAPQGFRDELEQESIFGQSNNPFSEFKRATTNDLSKYSKSEAHMYYAASNFIGQFHGSLEPSIIRAQNFLKQYLSKFVEYQAEQQREFLSYFILTLVGLTLFVYLPIDFMIRRLFATLNDKTMEARLALEKAQAADKAKSEFLATMSHEIRTPMNGVLGMAELLSKSDLDTRQKTFADIIIKSGNALLTIINDILDFSKIEAAQLHLVKAPFNLIESIEDIGTLLSTKAVEKDIELIISVDPAMPEFVIGDSGRLRQIMTNLIGNAVKFTDVGHVLVRTSCTMQQNENSADVASIRFEIEDTGIGIAEEQITKVFDKFSQVDGSTTRKHEGTGLGLAISARLVALMGGKIRVASSLNHGSSFEFTIDLPVDAVSEGSATDVDINIENARILIVDDNAVNRTILTEQASSWGHQCVAVESGPVGIKFLEYSVQKHHAKVDLVILDFHMPQMNGADVVRAIRANHLICDTPILLLSSVDQAHELDQLSDAKVDGHLSKPARSKLLMSTVNTILQKRSGTEHSLQNVADMVAEESNGKKLDVVEQKLPVVKTNIEPALSKLQDEEKLSLTILVAEDNPVNQIVFSEALKQFDFDFEIASDGREAVDMWRKRRPQLIVMDVSMPNMNGHEATQEIRRIEELEGLRHTPIIAVTAHAMKSDEQNCRDAGMDDYMTKPISPEMLNAKIKTWLVDTSREDQNIAV